MKLSNKHGNVQTVTFSDFTGGLNTADAPEDIANNELSKAINVEIHKGKLQTVAGTKRVYYDKDGTFTDLIYDAIEDKLLLIDADRNVFCFDNGELTKVGTLTGKSVIQYAAWEDGVLIASGGQLQYYHDGTLETIVISFKQDAISWTEVTPTAWQEGAEYAIGDVVTRNEKYYICNTAHTATPTIANDADMWQAISVNAWATNHSYAVDDIVSYQGEFYKCLTAHSTSTQSTVMQESTESVPMTFEDDMQFWEKVDNKRLESFLARHAQAWKTNTVYQAGAYIKQTDTADDGTTTTTYYKCLTAHSTYDKKVTTTVAVVDATSLTFDDDAENWEAIDEIPEWQKSTAYKVKDVVVSDNAYYRCLVAHTSNDGFATSYWNQTEAVAWGFDSSYTKNQSLILQDEKYYVCNTTHTSVTNAPNVCHGVFIKDGRVWIYYSDRLHCSGVGDEWNWTNNTNDASSAQWLQIGYKDGGSIVGVASLSSDTLIFKDNGHAYHLAGTFPDWSVKEIGRQIHCVTYNACISLADTTIVLGKTEVQSINVTDQYGDMQSAVISEKVRPDIIKVNGNAIMRYLPKLNQVWLIDGTKNFLFFDVNVGGWYRREYTTPVLDAVEVSGSIYLLKATGLYLLDDLHSVDEGFVLHWVFQVRTLLSNNEFLVKKLRVDTTPFYTNYTEGEFWADRVRVGMTGPRFSYGIYHDYTTLCHSKRPIYFKLRKNIYTDSDEVFGNTDYIYQNETYLWPTNVYHSEVRCVDRHRSVRVHGRGSNGVVMFNRISLDVAEV